MSRHQLPEPGTTYTFAGHQVTVAMSSLTHVWVRDDRDRLVVFSLADFTEYVACVRKKAA